MGVCLLSALRHHPGEGEDGDEQEGEGEEDGPEDDVVPPGFSLEVFQLTVELFDATHVVGDVIDPVVNLFRCHAMPSCSALYWAMRSTAILCALNGVSAATIT